jgi:hypothetical protein
MADSWFLGDLQVIVSHASLLVGATTISVARPARNHFRAAEPPPAAVAITLLESTVSVAGILLRHHVAEEMAEDPPPPPPALLATMLPVLSDA